MKLTNTLKFGLITLMGLTLMTSCKPNTEIAKVEQIATVLKSGTQIAVGAVVLSKPDSAKHFRAAVVGIKAALGAGDLTPAEVVDTISAYTSATGGTYAGVIEGGVGLALAAYKNFYEANADKQIDEYLKVLLVAIYQGIEGGLSGAPAAAGTGAVNPILELTAEDLKL